LQDLLDQLKYHRIAAHLGIVAIVVILARQCAPKKLQIVPAPLVAVVVATAAALALRLPVFYVEVPDRLWASADRRGAPEVAGDGDPDQPGQARSTAF
jgi:MFS superfamily sulfate permease-like transporter